MQSLTLEEGGWILLITTTTTMSRASWLYFNYGGSH